MKLIKLTFDTALLSTNQASLSDTIRMALYQENEQLFELLNYDNDFIFLEPSLFCYFLSDVKKENKISLEQSLLGYITEASRPQSITVRADAFGLANLPNWGYLRAMPNEVFRFTAQQIEPNKFLKNTKIRLCLHPTDHLGFEEGITFDEPIEQSLSKNSDTIQAATHFFQTHLPDFWQVIETVAREFVVFSSPPKYHSFAGIMQHGTAYFNVENKIQTPVFFIDDIAHQCGHIIFNALTLQTELYLKVPKDEPMSGYTEVQGETRGAYGAFHGLFTYTTILHSLDKVLELQDVFDDQLRHEALGRMGFYIEKFGYDLHLFHKAQILTDLGLDYWRQFAEGYQYIAKKYDAILSTLDYSNQPYTFQYDLFKVLNPIQKPLLV